MEKLSLSQIGLYNAQRMSDEVVERLFVVRQNLFELVLNKILAEPLDSIAQNHLFIGQRGMGKSTLLKRFEVELRTKHNKDFIPLLFPEEQYNIDKLADFWLNCLDAMADTLEVEKKKNDTAAIDKIVKELEKVDKSEVNHLAFERLTEISKKLGRRAVLLVDNLGLVFNRLESADKHLLRAQLMKNGAPILIGTNPVGIDETNEYGAPFYDWFSFHHLKKLNFEELKSILINLAKLTEQENLIKEIHQHQARLQTLHQLTGGNPRTTVMLFKLIINGFTSDINDDLEALLDEITPLYKARFEELPEKMQIIIDAIALAWHPVDLAKLRELTSLENQQLSPQIKRLVDLGWIEKVETHQKSSSSYQISERFFNIWFLMRRSSRRQKLQLYYLSRFLETLYGETLPDVAMKRLGKRSENFKDIQYNLALKDGLKDQDLKSKLQDKTLQDIENLDIKNFKNLCEIGTFDDEDLLIFYINSIREKIINKKFDKVEKQLNLLCQNYGRNSAVLFYCGLLFDEKNEFENAISYYEKVIQMADKYYKPFAYINLARLFIKYRNDIDFAKEAYHNAIKIDGNFGHPWNRLGHLYRDYYKDYHKAEEAYLKEIEINKNKAMSWDSLGNLYQDYLKQFQKAEFAYLNELKISPKNISPKFNLVFLYRDKLANLTKAKSLFKSLKLEINVEDSYYLNYCLFELYEKNIGLATNSLNKALMVTKDELPANTQDDWWRFSAVVHNLKQTTWLLQCLEESGYHEKLAPFYYANKALLAENRKGYLNSLAAEIRIATEMVLERIEHFLDD